MTGCSPGTPWYADIFDRCFMSCGGAAVIRDTMIATVKFSKAPTAPKASVDIPMNQFSGVLAENSVKPALEPDDVHNG
jgi:hypothetical protein